MTAEAEAPTSLGAPPTDQYIAVDIRETSLDADADADHEVDELADEKPKKKRRVIKISDKKYECPHPDCGKAYSRAEHLYRHQLNRMLVTFYTSRRRIGQTCTEN